MQSVMVEQFYIKWVCYNGLVFKLWFGVCIDSEVWVVNYISFLNLLDKMLQFVKDYFLMDDLVIFIDNRFRLIKKDVNYIQIVVDWIQVLDGIVYDVMFVSIDWGVLYKVISFEYVVYIIEEIQFFQDFELVQILLLFLKKGRRFVYVGFNLGVVQVFLVFCGKYGICEDCVLVWDFYCVWSLFIVMCVVLYQIESFSRGLIQEMSGDVFVCLDKSKGSYWQYFFKYGGIVELKCF